MSELDCDIIHEKYFTLQDYDIIRAKYFDDWFENDGCDGDVEEGFWRGYDACMAMHGLTKYVKDVENEP